MKEITPKNKARLEILNYIICFSTYKSYQSGMNSFPLGKEQTFIGNLGEVPPVGSLCRLTSAPFSKYYLAWMVDYRKTNGWDEYLLESIEDGSLCWWSNVGIDYYHPETVKNFPQWRWTDKQFEFHDKWKRACKRRDAYIVLPAMSEFTGEFGVTLNTRIRYGLSTESQSKTFPDYRKVKVKDMLEFYDYAVEQHKTNPSKETVFSNPT